MSSAGARPVCRRAPCPPPRAAARTRAPHRRRSRPSARQTTPRPRRASSLRASRAAARSRRRAGRRRAGRIGLDIGERAPGHGVPEAYRRAGKGSAGEREHAVVGMAGGACARDAGMHTRRARHTLPRRVAILISFSRHLSRLAALAPATAALLTAGLLAAGRLIRLDPHGFELLAARGHRRGAVRGSEARAARAWHRAATATSARALRARVARQRRRRAPRQGERRTPWETTFVRILAHCIQFGD